MVEINNQRKAFLDMLAWSEGTDNGRQKTRNHGYDVIVGGELFTDYSDHPRKLVTLNPKLKSTGAGRYQLLFPLVGCLPVQFTEKTSLRKVRTLWHCSRLRSVALYLWLIVVISVRQSTVAAISGFTAAGYGQFEHKAGQPDCKIRVSGRMQSEIDASRVTAIIPLLWLSASSSARHGLVNHYRDITYKAQRQKQPENWKPANAAIIICRCVSVMLLRLMQNTRRS